MNYRERPRRRRQVSRGRAKRQWGTCKASGKAKIKYPDEARATAHAGDMIAQGYAMNVYRCATCHCWHVGTTTVGRRGKA